MAHILIVEDDVLMQEVLSEVLKECGHTSTTALNGEEALAILERIPVALVLSDNSMPRMGGLELLKRIRARDKHLRFILHTGNPDPRIRRACEDLGGTFQSKAANENIVEVIEKLLEG